MTTTLAQVRDLHEKLGRARAESERIIKRAGENGYQKPEDREAYERADLEVRSTLDAIQSATSEIIKDWERKPQRDGQRNPLGPNGETGSVEERAAWEHYMVSGQLPGLEERAVTTASTGAPVPTWWNQEMVEKRDSFTFLTSLANVIKVPAGVGSFSIANESTLPTVTQVGENPGSDLAASDPTFAALLAVAPRDLLVSTDASVQAEGRTNPLLSGIVQRALSRATAQKVEALGIAGLGTGSPTAPTGLVTAIASGQKVALAAASYTGATAIGYLQDTFHKLSEPYRVSNRCAWIGSTTIMNATRKLVDSLGRLLWTVGEFNPDLRRYNPSMLLDRPAFESAYMPYDTPGAGAKVTLAFGDFAYMTLWDWQASGLLVDPYSKRKQLLINYSLHTAMDVTVLNTDAFSGLRFTS